MKSTYFFMFDRKILPRFHNRASGIFPLSGNRNALPALLLCLLLFFAAGCAAFSSSQSGQTSGAASANGSGKITYVAIGASDSFGIGTNDPYNENWPTNLMYLLGTNHIHLIDAGIPGILIHEVLNLELPIAVDARPSLVTIWLGVNDIVDNVPVSSYAQDLNVDLTPQNYNLQAHSEYISNDGLHPNDIGYQQLAKLFYTVIQAAQKQATTP